MKSIPSGEGPWKVDVDELLEKNDKEYKKQAYVPYLKDAIQKMFADGNGFPPVKKATSPTSKLQITGHLWIADALQGYWERHKKEYTHRAKSDYRALYIGTVVMLLEEAAKEGIDNSEDITLLETYIAEQEYRHKTNRKLSTIRSEVKVCLTELAEDVITKESFNEQMKEMAGTLSSLEDENKAMKLVVEIIQQEELKMGNRFRQSKHREFEQYMKGISLVTSNGDAR